MISTKRGDEGKTFLGKERVPKTDGRIRLLGKIDALTSYLGVVANEEGLEEKAKRLQDICYRMMGAIHESKDIGEEAIEEVEGLLEEIDVKEFIRPLGDAAHVHFARTLCREAEIAAFEALGRGNIAKCLNRMSDVLFIMAYRLQEKQGLLEGFRKD